MEPDSAKSLDASSATTRGAGEFVVAAKVADEKVGTHTQLPTVKPTPSELVGGSVVDADFVAINPNYVPKPTLVPPAFVGPGAAAAGSLDEPNSTTTASPSVVTPPSPVLDAPFNGALQPTEQTDAVNQGSLLDKMPLTMPEEELPLPPKRGLSRQRIVGFGLLAFGLLMAGLLGLRIEANKTNSQEASLLTPAARLQQQTLSLGTLNQRLGTAITSSPVTVNSSLVLTPSVQPSNPLPGQLYYDQTANQMLYYDGTGYVHLQGGNVVNNNTYNNVYTNSSVSNTYNNSTVNNTTLVTNVTNNNGAAINGTPGTLAMFSASGANLADSLITQNGSTLNVATSGVNTVSLGSNTGSSLTTVQSGLGGLNLITAGESGSSGNISITSGDSTGTAAGNVTIDTGNGFVSGTVVLDSTFEDGLDNFVSWIPTSSAVTLNQDCTIAHTGSCSLSITGPAFWGITNNGDGTLYTPITPGHHYYISAYVRGATGSASIAGALMWNIAPFDSHFLAFPTVTTTTANWTQMSVTGIAPAGATEGVFRFDSGNNGTSNGVQYLDDVTITDLTTGTSSSELDLGATNAQVISIGNMNEVGPTTIDGGSGITLNAGQANLTQIGGAVSITGSGASSFATSSGSLTLGAGGGTGGGVVVQTQANSTSAFSVQNAGGGTTLLNVDSTDDEISLGTGAGSAVGYSSVGPWFGGGVRGSISAQKITTTAAGTITSMSAYIGTNTAPNNLYQFAIYADNGSGTAPGAYIASSSVGTLGAVAHAWYTQPITATLSASTTYWLVYWQNWPGSGGTDNNFTYSPGGGSSLDVSGTATWATGPDNGMPATFPTVTTSDTAVASLYASYASSGPALTIDRYGNMTQNGAALFQDPTNTTVAFQVEDSLGNVLLAVDTADEYVAVSNLELSGHIITGGSTPAIAAGTAACTSPTVSVAGDDTSGTITITTGTGCSGGGKLATVTFVSAFGAAPHVELTPATATAEGRGYVDASTLSTTSFDVDVSAAPTSSTTYKWEYWTAQ